MQMVSPTATGSWSGFARTDVGITLGTGLPSRPCVSFAEFVPLLMSKHHGRSFAGPCASRLGTSSRTSWQLRETVCVRRIFILTLVVSVGRLQRFRPVEILVEVRLTRWLDWGLLWHIGRSFRSTVESGSERGIRQGGNRDHRLARGTFHPLSSQFVGSLQRLLATIADHTLGHDLISSVGPLRKE